MVKVDEFDHTGELASETEIHELLIFSDEHYPQLARELREFIIKAPGDYPQLLRILVDDMRRFQAGRKPRYTDFT